MAIQAQPSTRSLLSTNTSQFTDGGSNPIGGVSSTDANGTAVDQNVRSLSDYMTTHPIQNQEGTIMSNYNARVAATNAGEQANEGAINAEFAPQLSDATIQGAADTTNAEESQGGFTMNLPALRLVVQAGDKRVRDLTSQRDELIQQGKSAAAAHLDELLGTEQENITAARSAYVNNLIGIGQEARASASFRTPEQTAVSSLITSAPDAGITINDDLATATQKYRNSKSYKNNIAQGEATINAANAGAAASSASAAQTRTLTGMIAGGAGSHAQDIADLKSGKLTPESLQAKYAQYGQFSPAAAILSEAQSQGYDVNQGSLTGKGQSEQTAALNSGNPFTLLGAGLTQGLNLTGRTLGQYTSPSTSDTVTMTGPKGTFTVPQSQVATMQSNGYTISH